MIRHATIAILIVSLLHGCGGEPAPPVDQDTAASQVTDVSADTVSPIETDASADAGEEADTPTPDVIEDVVEVEDIEDAAEDAAEDAVEDVGDTIEDVEITEDVALPPPPCQSDEDCAANIMSNACKRPACNPASGLCIEVDQPVGTPCDEGDMCKLGQVCQAGQCIGGTNLDCSDDDDCTTDMCDPAQGCIFAPVPDCCVPNCEDKECGSDGCGGSCGTCLAEWSCNAESVCINCVPNCIGLTCGEDGCGSVCGVCPDEWFCVDPGICMECLPDCEGKICGGDGCGGSCGDCGFGKICNGVECVDCVPLCGGKECGDDDCGGSCGLCADNASCTDDGLCACIPNCGGKQCGDNGCGGTCGDCEVGEFCTPLNQCQVVETAKTCQSPIPVPGVPYYTTQNTSDDTNALNMPGGLCGFASDVGGGSPEHVYAFTPSVTDTYTFHVEPLTFDAAVYLLNDCSNASGSCLMGSDEDIDEILVAPLTAEKTYFLVVDGHSELSAAEGQYSVSIYAGTPVSCAASCEGKTCGTDGCGGSCGACSDDEECSADGACEVIKLGDTCEQPLVIGDLPFTATGNTLTLNADYNISSGGCPGVPTSTGQGASDVVYAFTPTVEGNYSITVPTIFDVVVYIVTDCSAMVDTCVAFSDDAAPNTAETFVTYLAANQTYYIIVDGNSWNTNLGGDFTFKITEYTPDNGCTPICAGLPCGDDGCGGFCGICEAGTFCENNLCVGSPLGDSCESAFNVNALPFYASNDTTGAQADYSFSSGACPGKQGGWGLKGSDEVYAFTPVDTGIYHIDVTAQYDAMVYVVTDCMDIDSSCVVASDNPGTSSESIVMQLDKDTQYFIIIDYWSNSVDGTGEYAITISQNCSSDCTGLECGNDGCGGTCGSCSGNDACVGGGCKPLASGGESCTSPFEVYHGLGSFYASGDTSGASPDMTHVGSDCSTNGFSADGPDHVYALNTTETATYTVTLGIPINGVDLSLWIATDCADPGNTCLGESDVTNFASSEEVITFDAQASMRYYIVVDSFYTSGGLETGPYTLEILGE
jgi:hypothetical protein